MEFIKAYKAQDITKEAIAKKTLPTNEILSDISLQIGNAAGEGLRSVSVLLERHDLTGELFDTIRHAGYKTEVYNESSESGSVSLVISW